MSSSIHPHAVGPLYQAHQGWLRNWLRLKLGCSETAADLAQDTYLRLLTSKSLPASLGPEPRALLTHIAKGLVVDHWRRQAVERAYLEAVAQIPAAEVPSAEMQLLVIEALTRIDSMLSSMPTRTREVFLMAQLQGLTLKQISIQKAMPVITIRRHIQKALVACMSML